MKKIEVCNKKGMTKCSTNKAKVLDYNFINLNSEFNKRKVRVKSNKKFYFSQYLLYDENFQTVQVKAKLKVLFKTNAEDF